MIADCRLSIKNCGLKIADCRLSIEQRTVGGSPPISNRQSAIVN